MTATAPEPQPDDTQPQPSVPAEEPITPDGDDTAASENTDDDSNPQPE